MRAALLIPFLLAFSLGGCLVEGDDPWQSESTPELDGGEVDFGDGGPPGWAEVQPILETKCGDCHGATPSQGAPYGFPTYEEAAQYADRIVIRVQQGTMPPVGHEQVTPEELTVLEGWLAGGKPQ